MKEALCRAFCGDLTLTDVPLGYAVSTTFQRSDGDAVGFYIVRDKLHPDRFRLEDDGTTISSLEAAGVEFSTETRASAFAELLETYGVDFDGVVFVLGLNGVEEGFEPFQAAEVTTNPEEVDFAEASLLCAGAGHAIPYRLQDRCERCYADAGADEEGSLEFKDVF